ncbi:MAG: UDP-3-O-(3-hydroxymyristoyl)glucosamine N-acyltransferase [Marinilabiliaceae bacterium]
MEFTAEQIATFLQGVVVGDPQVKVSDVSKIEEGRPGTLTFFSNEKYEHFVYSTQASIVLVDKTFEPKQEVKATMIKVENAREALGQLLALYEQMQPQKVGIEQPSFVSDKAQVGSDPYIGAFAYVADGAKLGNNVKIYPNAYIGEGVTIGDNTTIYAGVKIYKGCRIGNRCVIHAGAVIGADGFGFAPDHNGVYHKIPQIGIVIIEDDVEIGANTCIDRATMGATVIGHGTKLDDLIMIGHNVTMGNDNVMASQSGIAGSTKVGSNCVFAGQVGIAGHITIADRTTIAAQSGIPSSVKKPGQTLFGAPAFDYMKYSKSYVCFKQLPEIKNAVDMLLKERDEKNK